MTRIERDVNGYQVHYWTDGGMQNGYFIRDISTGDETLLYCDSEGGDYIDHVLQLGDGDYEGECDDALTHHRPHTQREEESR